MRMIENNEKYALSLQSKLWFFFFSNSVIALLDIATLMRLKFGVSGKNIYQRNPVLTADNLHKILLIEKPTRCRLVAH